MLKFISFLKRIASKISVSLRPGEWCIRLLKLPVCTEDHPPAGLIMIQIDGLTYDVLKTAIDQNRMPFLKSLLDTQEYRIIHHFPGLPSSTPSVQGELFFGVKQCVPAFSFRDHTTGKIHNMYMPDSASQIQQRIMKDNEPLLKGGSAYGNIFSGGADESFFCSATMGLRGLLELLNPYTILVAMIFNIHIVVHLIIMIAVELVLAVYDFIKGTVAKHDIWREFKFIGARLFNAVILPDLFTARVKIDAYRGLPIIQMNLFGYDEHAHRRGPRSKFAFWSMKGMDNAIKKVWKAAHRSKRRHYDMWVYSDHGQEKTVPYPSICHKNVNRAIQEIIHPYIPDDLRITPHDIVPDTLRDLAGKPRRHGIIRKIEDHLKVLAHTEHPVQVTAMGPIGSIYLSFDITDDQKTAIARKLAKEAKIPLVIIKLTDGKVCAYTPDAMFNLPQDAPKMLGNDHPYLNELTDDILRLTAHPDKGDFLICGWSHGHDHVSFPVEHGAHGWAGADETDGFIMLPSDIHITTQKNRNNQPYASPTDLREAVLRFNNGCSHTPADTNAKTEHITIMTYNIHSCIGMDDRISPDRIMRVISRRNPDIVALQEVDVGRKRTGGINQAQYIAEMLGMDYLFYPVLHIHNETYGNAILSKFPMKLIKQHHLPRTHQSSRSELRGALWAEIDIHGTKVQLINTHLGLSPAERKLQARDIFSSHWIGEKGEYDHLIICGDFNAPPGSPAYNIFKQHLTDIQLQSGVQNIKNTWYSRYPIRRIDHIFVGKGIRVQKYDVPATKLEQVASDHLPLISEILIEK